MRPGLEIRPLRTDDLRRVLILGTERLGAVYSGAGVSWNERNLAEIIADNQEVCFVAVHRKAVIGFIIGALENSGMHAGNASIKWLHAEKSGQIDVGAGLLHAFQQSLFEKHILKIRACAAASDTELIQLYKKFGFTETEQVLIMENFLSKNKKSGSDEA